MHMKHWVIQMHKIIRLFNTVKFLKIDTIETDIFHTKPCICREP